MNRDLLPYLCSPDTKEELRLDVTSQDGENIIEGKLTTGQSKYYIKKGIANFLNNEELEEDEIESSVYERKSLPYDELLEKKGISPEVIFTMDALRYSIAISIDKYVKKYARGIVLDLGAGKNILKGKYHDLSSGWIALDYDKRSTSIDVRGDGQELPIKSERIDTIISIDVLEHVPNPHQMIREIHRVLKKGGFVILSTPFLFWHHEEPFDFHRFTKYGLKKLFEENDFKIHHLTPVAGPIATFSFLFSVLIAKLFSFSSLLTKIAVKVNRFFQINLLLPLDRYTNKSGKMAQGHFIVAEKK